MITRIEIDGFKSFVDFSLDLHPFTAVIGTNASGKSNLVDAFRFLSELVRGDLYDAVDAVRGDAESLFHQFSDGTRVDTMRFAVELLLGGESTKRWRYEVEIGWRGAASRPAPFIALESLLRGGDDLVGFRTPDSNAAYEFLTESETATTSQLRPYFSVTPNEASPQADLERLRICQLETSALRRLSSIGQRPDIAVDGEGLPGYLVRLRDETKSEDDPQGVLRVIGASLRGLIPDVSGFDVLEDEVRRDMRIQFTSRNEPSFEAAIASGGTLRALALLAILRDPAQVGPVVIDEPENGVYPEHLRRLVRIMMETVSVPGEEVAGGRLRQVLVTGHSPVLVDVVPPEQLVILDVASRVGDGRKSRVTRARRAAATDAVDSTSNWGPLTPSALARLRVGEEMPA